MKLMALVLLVFGTVVRGESLSQSDMQNIQMLRAQAEMRQREEDLKKPVKVADPGDRATEGSIDASVIIYAFSDFQCPHCKNGAETVAEVRKKYKGKVKVQFRHMPLPFHSYAMPAAKRFEALALQSSKVAYKFHDLVFQGQIRFGDEGEAFLDEVAKKAGANIEKMKKDMGGEKVTSRIGADIAEASKLGITGTPAFIVAGVRLFGAYPAAEFSKIIDRRLKATK